MLKTQVQELEANKVALTVEVELDKVKEAYNRFYHRAAQYVRVPGFRKGKAPRTMISKYIGPDAVNEQVEEELLQEIVPQAIRDTKLHPVSQYVVEESDLSEGSPYKFKVVFEVMPVLGEINYKDIEISVEKTIIDDESVNKVLTQLQEQFSTTETLEDSPVQTNDYITAQVEVFCEGEKDEDLSDKKVTHKVAEDDKIYSHCLGMNIGETKEFEIKIDSEEEKDSKYYQKTLNYKVTIDKISRPIVHAIDDELAKKVGDYASLDELKVKIREDLEERAETDAKEKAFNEILKKMVEAHPLELPESLIQNTIDFFIKGLERRWQQYGTNINDYLKNSGQDIEEFRESFRPRAINQAKTILFADTISEREGIVATDEDYRKEIEKRAEEYRMPVDKLLAMFSESDGEDSLRTTIKTKKIREFLLKNNKIHYDMVEEARITEGE